MSSTNSPLEACPPPLMWQDVRHEFLTHSACVSVVSPVGAATVRVWGAGPPVYLLPGFTSPAELYCLLVWLLREDFRCVTIEPAGSGDPRRTSASFATLRRSVVPCTPFAHEVALLKATAEELGDAEFSLLGANYGAAWALAAAHAEPSRVARLMLIQGFAHRRLSFGERRLADWCRHNRRDLASLPFRETFQTQNHRRWFPPFDATRWQYYLDATGAMPLRELARRADAVSGWDLRRDLSKLHIPTLLIRTEGEGRLAAGCQAEIELALPGVQTEWMHSTGQLPYLTHPHRLAKLMRAFCAASSIEHIVSDAS